MSSVLHASRRARSAFGAASLRVGLLGLASYASLAAVAAAVAVATLATTGCVGGSKTQSPEDKERLKSFVVDALPSTAKKLDANFENKIHLIGYRAEPESAPPGTEVKLTYYWRCDDPIEAGWALSTHIQHEGFERPDNADGVGALREWKDGVQIFGPSRWERGKIYVDEQTYRMPAELRGMDSLVYVSIWKNDARLRIISGPTDGENRALVVKLRTGVAPKAPGVPELEVKQLARGEKIVVDGKGDEAAWKTAPSTGAFVNVGTGAADHGPLGGSVKLAWDNENLYALFEVRDPAVTGGFTDAKAQPKRHTTTGQPMLWTGHTVEMMVDRVGDNASYYELQINPQNKIFRSRFAGYNAPRGGDYGPFGNEDWDPKLKSAVVVNGTIDKADDKDEGYVVEVAIPWKAYAFGLPEGTSPTPKSGDTWHFNFYAMQDNGGVAWSPILGQGNFHRASRFGKVRFVTDAPLAAADAGPGAPDASPGPDAGRAGAKAPPAKKK
ncbi:MAG TPA: carbohydrate-binding family 9-like protein [Polyangiaceae bacterium]|nr:carbohydrate-binding family 9-like protein [Polyangiaceae bacterium]